MKKMAKIIRIISVAPIGALTLLSLLYFKVPGSFSDLGSFLFSVSMLAVLPLLAYPVQWVFRIFKDEDRNGSRKLAIVFSVIGYATGLVIGLIFHYSALVKIVFSTYFMTGIALALSTFVFKIKASGHMSGVAGPIAVIILVLGWRFLPLLVVLLVVFWASLFLNRHSQRELVLGSLIPIVAMMASIGIFS